MRSAFLTVATVAMALSGAAGAAEFKVLAPGAAKEIMNDILPAFEKASGHRVRIEFAGTATIEKRLAAGDVFDLVIVGAPVIDAFIRQGKLAAGSRTDLLKSGVGAAVRAGAPRPISDRARR
jgi:molybdate transport system substrate-binding protein